MNDPFRIAEAVVSELNGHSFSRSFTAVRLVVPSFELAELATLHVSVMPASAAQALETRACIKRDIHIDIGVQQKIAGDIEAEVPPLMDLVEDIAAFLTRRPLADAADAMWTKTTVDPLYLRDHLVEQRLFTSIVSVDYRLLEV